MEVDRSVVPIFIETEIPKQIKQIGTGVFLDFQSQPFLFTAAHVIDDLANGRLLVPTINGLSEIEGYMAHVDFLPEMSRNDDTVDMAYYRLNEKFASSLCFNFFPLIEKTELVDDATKLGVLSVVGYPANKSKRRDGKYTSELAYYRGVAAEKDAYDKLGLSTDQNIVIQFKRKNAVNPETGKNMNSSSPKGVSGGGIFLWPYGNEFSQDWKLPKLVGIFHSYIEKEGLMIGTTLLPFMAATVLGNMKNYGNT